MIPNESKATRSSPEELEAVLMLTDKCCPHVAPRHCVNGLRRTEVETCGGVLFIFFSLII